MDNPTTPVAPPDRQDGVSDLIDGLRRLGQLLRAYRAENALLSARAARLEQQLADTTAERDIARALAAPAGDQR